MAIQAESARLWRFLLLAAAVVILGALLFQMRSLFLDPALLGVADFVEYWSAARLLVSGGNPYSPEQLFPLQAQQGWDGGYAIMMWNPPWTLALLFPFGWLDFAVARLLWLGLHVAIILWAADWLWRFYGGSPQQRWLAWVVSLVFVPTLTVLRWGQIGPLLLLGVVGFLFFEKRRRDFLAGAALALVFIKPHLLYLVPVAACLWAMRQRRWGILLGGASALLAATAIPLLFDPWLLAQYRQAVATQPPTTWITTTFGALLRTCFGPEKSWLQFLPSGCGLVWLLAWWFPRRQTWDLVAQLPLLILVSVTTTSFGWLGDQVVLLPAVVQAAVWVGRVQDRRVAVGAASFFLVVNVLALAISYSPLGQLWYLWFAPALLAGYLVLRRVVQVETPAANAPRWRVGLTAFWRPETGIFLAIWLLLMIGGRSRLFRDPGTFWHTVVGERILTSGRFSDTDTFSYTFAGQRWIPHQWLGECTMALLHRLDGFDTLLLATVTILAALFTWAAGRLLRAGLHWSLTAMLVVLAVGAGASHFHVRPHIATMVFLGITFAALAAFENKRLGVKQLFWLVPVYVLWTNIHGGMLGGLVTIGAAVAYWSLSWLLGRETPIDRPRQILALGGLLLACGLTAFVNPYGPELPRAWFEIMDSPLLTEIIVEHARLNPTHPDGFMVLFLGAVYGVALLGVGRRWPRATWLLPLLWLALACSRIRHAPLFAITAVLALADVLPRTWWAAWLAGRRDLFRPPTQEVGPPRFPDWRPALLPAVVILLAVVLQVRGVTAPVVGHGWAHLDEDCWPVELLPALQAQEQSQPPGTPIFNELNYGGFLIYYTPGFQIFVDDRCELYGDRWLLEYVRAEEHETGPKLQEMQQRYGPFQLALTRTGSGYDQYFRSEKDWTVVCVTRTATLYQRKSTALRLAATR